MEYKISFKRFHEEDKLEKDYVSLGNGLQYKGIENAPAEVYISIGAILSQISLEEVTHTFWKDTGKTHIDGHYKEIEVTSNKIYLGDTKKMIVPEGMTLEMIFKN